MTPIIIGVAVSGILLLVSCIFCVYCYCGKYFKKLSVGNRNERMTAIGPTSPVSTSSGGNFPISAEVSVAENSSNNNPSNVNDSNPILTKIGDNDTILTKESLDLDNEIRIKEAELRALKKQRILKNNDNDNNDQLTTIDNNYSSNDQDSEDLFTNHHGEGITHPNVVVNSEEGRGETGETGDTGDTGETA